MVAAEEYRRVLDALGQLSQDDAELLRLVAWEGLSTADVAAVLDVRPNTASQRLTRARSRLTREFDRTPSAVAPHDSSQPLLHREEERDDH